MYKTYCAFVQYVLYFYVIINMSDKFRPNKFNDVVGNELNIRLLLAIAKSDGPSTIIMCGPYGSGKLTLSRLFSKAVNCNTLLNDICNECETCQLDYINNSYYSEYEAYSFSSVENVREMRNDLTSTKDDKKKVIVFKDFDSIQKSIQVALLRIFEIASKNIYYILCANDKSAILSSIVSRSLVLHFTNQSKVNIINNIKYLAQQNNINISDKAINVIAVRSNGCLFDAHKLLEKYYLIGEDAFLKFEESGYIHFAKYFANVLWLIKNKKASSDEAQKHKFIMNEIVEKLMQIPTSILKDDYQSLFLDIIKKIFNDEFQVEPIVSAIIKAYDTKSIMNLYKVATDDFMMSSFDDDIRFQTALYSIYQRLLMGI